MGILEEQDGGVLGAPSLQPSFQSLNEHYTPVADTIKGACLDILYFMDVFYVA